MAYYDQLAFSSKPAFYLGAPTTTDQSGGSLVVSANTLVANGQPIIYGHSNSFTVNETSTMTIDDDAVFHLDTTVELVINATKPTAEIAIIKADNGSGLFLAPVGLILRIVSTKDDASLVNVCSLKITDWHKKLYITFHTSFNQAVLSVNGSSVATSIIGTIATTTDSTIGTDFYSGYSFLLDGFGIYAGNLENKANAIDDPGSGHTVYTSTKFGAQTTLFETYKTSEIVNVSFSSFYLNSGDQSFIYTHLFPNPAIETLKILIKTNDDNLPIEYDFNAGTIDTFYKNKLLTINEPGALSFRLSSEVKEDFVLTLLLITDYNITTRTPAALIASDAPIFTQAFSEEIANCPEGTNLDGVSYQGTWITSEFQAAIPKSIELVFKPKNSSENVVIFSSSDGTIAIDAQAGYDMWLNGILVTDLADVRWNQWNHLVLINTSPAATGFYLNTDGTSDPLKIDYLYLTSIDQELEATDIELLYTIVSGIDVITVDTDSITIAEETFDSGEAFALYSLTWSIVGAGGS